jgi:hypothetical protein
MFPFSISTVYGLIKLAVIAFFTLFVLACGALVGIGYLVYRLVA